MKNLPVDLNTFPFFEREKKNGKMVRNRCGRDFIFYALAFYFPDKFGVSKTTAHDLEYKRHLGISVPAFLAWTQLQFCRVSKYLKTLGLRLVINNREIKSFSSFVRATLFSRMSYDRAILNIEQTVYRGEVVGVDISVGFGGLLDHVLFVYGYDADNLYVFETTDTPIQYEDVSEGCARVMRLSKSEIKKRWTRFGRVWRVMRVL